MTDYDQKYDMTDSALPNMGAAHSVNPNGDNTMRAGGLEPPILSEPDPKAHALPESNPNPGGLPFFVSSVADSARRNAQSANEIQSTTKSATWRPRAGIAQLKRSPRGRRSFGLGARVGYWPCLLAPYLQLTIGFWKVDVWCGYASYKAGR